MKDRGKSGAGSQRADWLDDTRLPDGPAVAARITWRRRSSSNHTGGEAAGSAAAAIAAPGYRFLPVDLLSCVRYKTVNGYYMIA